MAYQVVGLRSQYNEAKRKWGISDETFVAQRWWIDDPADIFNNPAATLDRLGVPLEDRWNLFYTVNDSTEKKRTFKQNELLAFDIDGLDRNRIAEYIPIVLAAASFPPDQAAVVSSGNGLHFILRLKEVSSGEFIDERKAQYGAIGDKINAALKGAGLPGATDRSVFHRAGLLRFPSTINRKPNKEKPDEFIDRQAETLLPLGSPQDYDWDAISGMKKLSPEDTVSKATARKLAKNNNDGVEAFQKCLFLKHVKENPAAIDEPLVYAACGLIGFFEKGEEQAVDTFRPRYNNRTHGSTPEAILDKVRQNKNNSTGPRTCGNINNVWGKCGECPYYGKISTPLVIFKPDVIPTEANGFWNAPSGPKNVPSPNYDDLLRAFYRDRPYFFDQISSRIYAFDGKKYVVYDEDGLKAWCESKMDPKPKKNQRSEFAAKIFANHYRNKEASEKFFHKTIINKFNLDNGVFNLETGELEDHTADYGFTYVLPYNYDPAATCPTFLKFLDDVTMQRVGLMETLIDFMAYAFVHDYPDHCFLWMTGTGRNGKSTLADLMALVVGAENASRVMLDGFEERFSIETMHNKLINIAEETEEKRIPKKQLSTLKALSAGAPVQVEAKGERPFTMRPTAKMIFMANEAPKFGTANQAIKSRLLLVPFDKQLEGDGFCLIDDTLPGRLAAELPGIFNLLVARLKERTATRPFRVYRNEISTAEVAELMREGDQLLSWVQDNCELGEEFEMCGTAAFKEYSGVVTERFAGTRDGFSKRLKNLFPGRVKVVVGWNQETKTSERKFSGIKLGRIQPKSDTIPF